jgi:uncharacterized protein involved in exopolysaccharide biosynthesis
MSIVQLLRILMARRWIIFTAAITCLVVALATAKTLPSRYEASARVVLDILKPDPVTGQTLGNGARAYVSTQIELIQDYRIAGDVVDRLDWMQNPAVIANWQAETGGVGDMRRWASQRIISGTSAAMIEGSNILEIKYTAPTPEAAKQIVNLLRESFIEASLRFKTDSAGRTADWYREQADRAQRSLIAAETAKAQFEQANSIIVGPSGEAEQIKLANLQTAYLTARGGATSAQYEATKQSNSSPVVDQMKVQLAQLNDEIGQANERFGKEHPTYKALMSRRAMLQTEIARETSSARAAGAALSGASSKSIGQLEAEYNAQRAVVLGMKDKLNQLNQLDREVALRRAQYEKAAERAADLRLESSLSESGLVVLGDAIANNKAVFPNWPLIIALALLFGLGLGIVVALLVELMARRVRGPEDLAFASSVPVLAVVAEQRPSPWQDRLRRRFLGRKTGAAEWQPAQ